MRPNFQPITQPTIQNNNSIVGSEYQSGGNVNLNVNQALPPEWSVEPSQKINDSTWKTKMRIKGKGKLTYLKWNILLTCNTNIIKDEKDDNEFTKGMWNSYGNPPNRKPNQIFLGFEEFYPLAVWSEFIYSKDSLIIINVDSLNIDSLK